MIGKYSTLQPDSTYHFYNRANGSEKLFLSGENYNFFLLKYSLYISPLVDTFCYCLMPNHFHFLIRIKNEKELRDYFTKAKKTEIYNLEDQISKQFSNFFNSYSKAFNKVYKRKGSLFMNSYKRKKITDDTYLKHVIYYIHHNPIEAKLCRDIKDYQYSSYNSIISQKSTFLMTEETLNIFEGLENFIDFHERKEDILQIDF